MKILILESNYYSINALKIYSSIGKIYKEYDKKKNYSKISIIISRLGYKLDENFLKKFTNLNLIITNTTGTDHIDFNYLKKKNIKVISLNNCKSEVKKIQSTAELTLGLIILLHRNILKYCDNIKKNNWNRYAYKSESFKGKTVGIIGYGRIGQQLKKIFSLLQIKIVFFDTNKKYKKNKLYATLKSLLKQSDILSINASLNAKSTNLISKREFLLMKKNVVIVNTARAEIIDEKYLYKYIKNKKISGFASDVQKFENKKIIKKGILQLVKENNYNIILTPHIGGATFDAMRETEEIVANYFKKNKKNYV